MTVFAYCRVSTLDQNSTMQEDAIKKRYPDAVFRHESKSGTSMKNREMLKILLDVLSPGDKLVVWKLDRLARNMKDLTEIVDRIEKSGASVEILDQAIDTSTASGKAFLQMLGVFAEFETNLRKERQMAGIKKAKEQGRYRGRSPVDTEKLQKAFSLIDSGVPKTKAAKEAGISVATLYRELAKLAPDNTK